jgi:hypothetical protein
MKNISKIADIILKESSDRIQMSNWWRQEGKKMFEKLLPKDFEIKRVVERAEGLRIILKTPKYNNAEIGVGRPNRFEKTENFEFSVEKNNTQNGYDLELTSTSLDKSIFLKLIKRLK